MAEILAAFIDAHIALGLGTPGGLDPIDLDTPNPVTDLTYDSLPEMYRKADAVDDTTALGFPLYGFVDAIADPLVEPLSIAGDIAGGLLTDPSLAPDEWIPWLARATGIIAVGLENQRTQLANLVAAPPLGSRRYMEVVTQQFLTGTKFAQAAPAEPWGIQIRVRADEILVAGGPAGLAEQIYATGLVPAGFLLQILTEEETWAQIQVPMTTWAPGQGATWARMQSMGLAGSGYATGYIVRGGAASGDAP